VTVPVTVQVSAQYSVSLDLVASNGKSVGQSAVAQLSAGGQQVVLTYPVASLQALGINGPFTEAHARLVLMTSPSNVLADYI
jgi:hypothetical protein